MAHRILLIDDSKAIHSQVRAELGPEGYELYSAYDGPGGIRAAMTLQPDIILLDLEMPGMNGHEVCELLGIQPETSRIPVMFLSAIAGPADRAMGLNQGATDYIAKPFTGDELRARIRVSLRYKFLVELETRRAMRDGMTGLWNRLYFETQLSALASTAQSQGHDLSCIMADVDHFKLLNDNYGHPFGDAVIRAVAETLQRCSRREDVVCRYGGEEFVVLCPGMSAHGARFLAELFRSEVAGLTFPSNTGTVGITCSLGVACLRDCNEMGIVAAADKALYRSKSRGRNRTEMHESLRPLRKPA